MQLLVRSLRGRTICLDAGATLRVADVKALVLLADGLAVPLGETRLVHGGQTLGDATQVAGLSASRGQASSFSLEYAVRGGGGDGGATGAESRDCYLQMYLDKKPEKVDPFEAKLARFMHCTLSQEMLTPPCVVDMLGNLFNKEAIVQALVTKSMPPKLRHIRGLKDILDIHLTEMPAVKGQKGSTFSRFQCPITGLDFNGRFRFYVLKSCGHVLSAKALKELSSASCLVCRVPFTEEDKLIINGTEEEVDVLRTKMEEEREAKAKNKKDRKRDKVQSQGPVQDTLVGLDVLVKEQVGGLARSHGAVPHVGEKRKVGTAVNLSVSEVSVERPHGSDRIEEYQKHKKVAQIPAGATKSVYSSIFLSSRKEELKETYMCRSLPLARN